MCVIRAVYVMHNAHDRHPTDHKCRRHEIRIISRIFFSSSLRKDDLQTVTRRTKVCLAPAICLSLYKYAVWHCILSSVVSIDLCDTDALVDIRDENVVPMLSEKTEKHVNEKKSDRNRQHLPQLDTECVVDAMQMSRSIVVLCAVADRMLCAIRSRSLLLCWLWHEWLRPPLDPHRFADVLCYCCC